MKLIPKEVNINRFPNLDKFKQKHVDVEQAIKRYIKPGDRIFIDSGCSEPIDLTSKLIELGPQLSDVEMIHFISLSDLDLPQQLFLKPINPQQWK